MYIVSVIKQGRFNMANYLQLGQGLMKHLPTAEGCTSTVKLSKKGIEALAKKNSELGKVIEGMTRGAENPTLEIAQKAKGNYAIAGFKIRNGETVLGKGAYSTSTGANGVVEKMHVESGDIITTVTKEGDKVVSKNVSKSELAKAAQEKAKASEFMTKEGVDAHGDKVLIRKFKNGTTVASKTLKDGKVQTTVVLADGTKYTRIKEFTHTPLENNKVLQDMFPSHKLGFERVEKNLTYLKDGYSVKQNPSGVIYANHLDTKPPFLTKIPVIRYKGRNSVVPNGEPKVFSYTVTDLNHGNPKEVTLYMQNKDTRGFTQPIIAGQDKLQGWDKLKSVTSRDLISILP